MRLKIYFSMQIDLCDCLATFYGGDVLKFFFSRFYNSHQAPLEKISLFLFEI